MTKRSVIQCVLSIVLIAYLAVALCFTFAQAKADPYKSIKINIVDAEDAGFVTTEDIKHELGPIFKNIGYMRADSVSTLDIERRILAMDNIEWANCAVLNNRHLRLDVQPLIPVARVFDTSTGTNYYINRAGKRMKANARYRIDAPVMVGRFSERAKPTDALPVLDYISSHQELTHLISSIKMQPNGDILLVPRIRGHVVNFGDTADIANKFDRLLVFYRKVMPYKGWEYYDTLSVKWRGQVVAKKHDLRKPQSGPAIPDEEYIDDIQTMTPD